MTPEQEYVLDRCEPEPNTGCWLWARTVGRGGYGQCQILGKDKLAHRLSYEAFIGPIPAGLTLDHRCRVRSCVNPAHLAPMSMRDNTLARGCQSPANLCAQKTHCSHGHPLSGKNVRVEPHRRGLKRVCVACKNDRNARAYLRRRAAQQALRES